MAGIIAHTVGVIAAAGAEDGVSTDHNITVGDRGDNVWGYDEGQYGSIDSAGTGGHNIIQASSGDPASSRQDFRFQLDQTGLAQDFFTSLTIETDTGTVTIFSADAGHSPSVTAGTIWTWPNGTVGEVVWDSADFNNVRSLTVNY